MNDLGYFLVWLVLYRVFYATAVSLLRTKSFFSLLFSLASYSILRLYPYFGNHLWMFCRRALVFSCVHSSEVSSVFSFTRPWRAYSCTGSTIPIASGREIKVEKMDVLYCVVSLIIEHPSNKHFTLTGKGRFFPTFPNAGLKWTTYGTNLCRETITVGFCVHLRALLHLF